MGVSKCVGSPLWLLRNVRVVVCGSWDELGLPCPEVAVCGGYTMWGCWSVGVTQFGDSRV